MSNCRNCFNLVSINEQGGSERRCKEMVETKYGDNECEKYVMLRKYCSDCD